MSTNQRSIDWYDHNADNYTAHVRNPDDSIFHSLYEKPAMYGLLPDLSGKAVLSLGCGSGEDCQHLLEQGATRVEGVDISEGMIKIAQNSYPECNFQVMDMEQLTFGDESFDFVYSSLAIHYIETWSKVFSEAYRVLRPGTHFLFSCNHPVYTAMVTVQDDDRAKVKQLSRTKNRATDMVEIVGNYVTRRATSFAGDMAVTTWHKSIGEIVHEATGAGFVVADVHEPKPLPQMAELSPNDYETLLRIPNFIIFKLFKA